MEVASSIRLFGGADAEGIEIDWWYDILFLMIMRLTSRSRSMENELRGRYESSRGSPPPLRAVLLCECGPHVCAHGVLEAAYPVRNCGAALTVGGWPPARAMAIRTNGHSFFLFFPPDLYPLSATHPRG